MFYFLNKAFSERTV